MISKKPIYLDYNATAPIKASARTAVINALDHVGNASSIHGFGRDMRKTVEQARDHVAALVGVPPVNVTFTSGATEANNTALFGAFPKRILISAIEHPSVIDAVKYDDHFDSETDIIPVTPDGVVDLEWLKNTLADDERETLISVMMVNNETGVIQPIKEIAAIAATHENAMVHTDAVQAAGRIPIDMDDLGVHFMSLSAHKFGGPMGVGALIFDHDHALKKLIKGGGQERSRRAGTENAPAIAGFGAAALDAVTDMKEFQERAIWRAEAEKKMTDAVPKAIVFGQKAERVANTIQISLPSLRAEKQLIALDLDGIAVSSGSACSSGSVKPSHVLLAMGATPDQAMGALRCSFGWDTTKADLDAFVTAWIKMAQSHGF